MKINMPRVVPIKLKNRRVRIIDQTRLPVELIYEDVVSAEGMWEAIKKLKVRGAPLIGIAGAMGFLLGIYNLKWKSSKELIRKSLKLKEYLASSRPTAVNLFWALELMHNLVKSHSGESRKRLTAILEKEAERIRQQDIEMCFKMSSFGASIIHSGMNLLTVCNAGALATGGYGTALGVFYRAKELGKKIKVYACETRPLLQGARLTSWELMKNGIDSTLICDNMAADLMRSGKIDAVFVGADRIASNGDFANKIGTYNLAVLADYHKVPFYCVAPFSTFDLSISCGSFIPIEQRGREEVSGLYFKKPIAPKKIKIYNPAFDVTPHQLVSAIITEKGIIHRPCARRIKSVYGTVK